MVYLKKTRCRTRLAKEAGRRTTYGRVMYVRDRNGDTMYNWREREKDIGSVRVVGLEVDVTKGDWVLEWRYVATRYADCTLADGELVLCLLDNLTKRERENLLAAYTTKEKQK